MKVNLFIYLGFNAAFNTGHITMGSWKGRGNQYIEFARVVYCKLPTNGKQLPAFPLEPMRGSNPGLRGGRRECYQSATMAPVLKVKCFKEDPLTGSKVVLVSWCKTSERFQEGIAHLPWGLFLWKLSRKRVTFSSLLMLKGEIPSLSAMTDL